MHESFAHQAAWWLQWGPDFLQHWAPAGSVVFAAVRVNGCCLQAFINTARKIYEKIDQGIFDVSNEVRLPLACTETHTYAHTCFPLSPPAQAPPPYTQSGAQA